MNWARLMLLLSMWPPATLAATAQSAPVLMQQVVSREVSVFVGEEPVPPYRQVVSREVSLVVSTPQAPTRVTPLTLAPSPMGDTVTVSWTGYNEWAERDVARYDIYLSTRPFTNISLMTRYAAVPAETRSITLTNLPVWEDHFFAVVAVDAAGGLDPGVGYSAAYALTREVVSRETSVFVGAEPEPPHKQVLSREVSLLVTTPQAPARVTPVVVAPSPMGDTVTLGWTGYNEWAERDVARYDIYLSTRAFTNIAGMTRRATVPAETRSITLTDLPVWEDHFFAVVAVDAANGFDPAVVYVAAYSLTREVVSRETSVFVGAEPEPPYQQVVSREVSVVVPTAVVPDPVTGLGSGFAASMSMTAYGAIDLDWSAYNWLAQKDIVRYRIYLGSSYYDNAGGMEPYGYAPAEATRWVIEGLNPMGIYYVAVVAEDLLGQWNPVVRSVSAQASIVLVGEVRDLRATCGTNLLQISWLPPDLAESFLVGYRLYFAAASTPVLLPPTTTAYTVTDLQPAHGYPVRISTVDKFGFESSGASLLAATLLPNPTGPVPHGFDRMVRLNWEHVEPNELVRQYAVYVATANFTSVAGMTPVVLTRARQADVPGLVNGTSYFFAVTTINIVGGESPDVTAITAGPSPVVGNYADLIATNVHAPVLVYPGKTGTFSWRVTNVGANQTIRQDHAQVAAWVDRVLLSANDALGDADDVAVADVLHSGVLNALGSYTTNVSVQVPRIQPGDYHVFVVADALDEVYEFLDAGANAASATNVLQVRLTIAPDDQRVDELQLLTVMNTPAASDLPGGTLTFALSQAPIGMTIHVVTGAISWRPNEAQGPSMNLVTQVVTDVRVPALSVTNQFTVTVNEVNTAPLLAAIPDQMANANQTVNVTTSVADADLPAQTLTYTLEPGAPAGAAVSASGVFAWTPTVSQVGRGYNVGIRVTDDGTPAMSSVRTFTVVVGQGPSITQQPASQSVPMGGNATFTVTASGTGPLSYQWRKDGVSLERGTNNALVIIGATVSDAGIYTVVVSNAQGSLTSAPAVLTLTGDPPRFATALRDRVVKQGRDLRLSATALGWEPIAYQWFFNSSPILGSDRFELAMGSIQPVHAGRYHLQASNYFGMTTSSTALVTVLPPLRITTVKSTNHMAIGASLRLQITAEGEVLSYQWQINGEAIPGGTNDTYLISSAQPKDGGSYRVIVANDAEVVAADIAEVIINVPIAPVGDHFADRVLLSGPSGVVGSSNEWATVEAGEARHAGKAGGHSIWYRWVAPGQGNATFETSGSTFDTLLGVYTGMQIDRLEPVASDEDGGGYLTSRAKFPVLTGIEYQIAIDGFAGATGKTVLSWTLDVTPDLMPGITQNPADQAVVLGGTATFQVGASGNNLGYQWWHDGTLLTGATGRTLVLTNVQLGQLGGYLVRVMNETGTRTSESAVAHLEGYAFIEGQLTTVEVGQDKREDLGLAGGKAGRLGFGWRVVSKQGLSLVSGYSLSRWADNTRDTTQESENQSGSEISNNSRWYALKVSYPGICTLSTEGSEFRTLLQVYERTDRDFLRLASDEKSGADGQSRLQFEAWPDGEYYIRVAGVLGEKGLYKLTQRLELLQQYRQWEHEPGADLVFKLQVPRDIAFRVDRSSDLTTWSPYVSTNSSTGLYELRMQQDDTIDLEFYRALLQLAPGEAVGDLDGN